MGFRYVILILIVLAVAHAAADPADMQVVRELYRSRQLPEAGALLQKLAAEHPDDASVHYYSGMIAMKEKRFEDAVAAFERAVKLEPGNSDFHLELGGAYGAKTKGAGMFAQMRFASLAREQLEKAVELAPGSVEARLGLLQFYERAPAIVGGGIGKAVAEARQVARLDPVRGRPILAELLVKSGNPEAAFDVYRDALRDAPEDYASQYQLGRLSATTGLHFEEGISALRRCLALDVPPRQPGHASANWQLGTILERVGDRQSAKAAYEAALRSEPGFGKAREALDRLD